MKLYIKRDTSVNNSAFIIFDELGCEKFYISPKKAGSDLSILIIDKSNNILGKIRRLPILGTKSYVFRLGKNRIAFTCIPVKNGINCRYYGKNWHILGDLISKNFSIADVDNTVIATHTKNLADCELNVKNPADELYCLATAICINLINTVDNRITQAV